MARRPQPSPALFEVAPASTRRPPTGLSVSALVSYARCPRQCYWTVVDPRPRQGSPAAQVGTLLHGWIERRAAGQGSLLDVAESEAALEPERVAGLKGAFLASPYAGLRPLAVERPFTLTAGGLVVRGRVDALYEREGRLEIVDFKTGRRPPADDRSAGLQLEIYALAAVDCWGHQPDRLRTTAWYLGAGDGDSRQLDAAAVEEVRSRLADALARLADEQYGATPGSYCRRCDFAGFCRAGRAFLEG